MTAASSGRWIPSSKRNPCPICGRTSDGDCRTNTDGQEVICHHPKDYRPGEVVNGWAFTGNTSDGRAGHFVLDKPLERTARPKVVPLRTRPQPPAAAPITGLIRLARLSEPAPEPEPKPSRAVYQYGERQQARREPGPDGAKVVRPWHHDGQRWICAGGPEPWPLYRQAEALGADGWLLELEGEQCTDLARAGSAVAISQPGHDHKPDSIRQRYAVLKAAGVAGIIYISDHDRTGVAKAERCAAAAASEALPFLHLPAVEVWPDLPAGGSIDDAPGTPAERVAALEAAVQRARHQQAAPQQEPDQDRPKRRRLAPDEVLAMLPERIGTPRLNVRSRAVHLPDRVITGNDAGHLYLALSGPAEVWPKEPTADALAFLANRQPFDPALEELEAITAGVDPLPLEEWQRLDLVLLNIADPIAAAFLPRFLIGAVARLYEPGCQVDQTPVLVGKQGIGKTQLGRALFGHANFGDQLGSRLDVDDVTRLHRYWALELAELDGVTRRSDQEALKAFLTRQVDTERRKYARDHEELPRRSVFWGTSNGAPLRDLSGSRRFVAIPLPGDSLPLDRVIELRPMLWARALEQYRVGVQWFSPAEEAAAIQDRNLDHQQIDPWAEIVSAFLELRRPAGVVQVNDLLEHLEIPRGQRSPAVAQRVGSLVEAHGWTRARRRLGKRQVAGFFPPG